MTENTKMLQLILDKVTSIEERVTRIEGKQDTMFSSFRYLEEGRFLQFNWRTFSMRQDSIF